MIGLSSDNNLYGSVLCFMIVGLKENVPYVVKAVPIVNISGDLIKRELLDTLPLLFENGFNVRAAVCDNQSSNVSAFEKILEHTDQDKDDLFCLLNGKKAYLFFDSVHLIKNIRNNLLNRKRFIFPSFTFEEFFDKIEVKSGEISWKLFHSVHEMDSKLDAHLKNAYKLSNKELHPGKYK